ncbi:DUF309 domain-containing protein [Paenibacillus apiarius]|uniref:DUF309 domain-containing protein n=1 Tax=Paenibacillus apiarius TaxID=46240 RepID=A0ABT4E016_9BACL|nr:DUF309 domain-containing protein [Paenibacillus apiarius]MCY9515078.1 DUF309 domain-containing protein [Paenibacillus apiarius]MCY9522936.1 DUF309 domain-containing protein [Paenibacillus apiarius]MCY9553739.1 DUF309 domain-containing protein [Paenibacillus apiarius]MCY9556428.1 DUF309 domain-containing protein [Paenibacillus apiarius]MCY9684862.1 DUF309 domain-containing protein [Paenibacillus apiarius]
MSEMADKPSLAYDCLYVQFIKLFNEERDYYACHDVMEELWLEEGRKPLLQGLLQVAVGLYHFQNGNHRGAIKLLEAALDKLNLYPEYIMGIHLEKLRLDAGETLALLRRSPVLPPFSGLTIDIVDERLQQEVAAAVLPTE